MRARDSFILLFLFIPILASAQPLQCSPDTGAVYVRSLQDGERDLLKLAKESEYEDCFLYCNGRWYDIGIGAKPKEVGISFDAYYNLLKIGAFPSGKEVIKYHIHPLRSYRGPVASLFVSGSDFSTGGWYMNMFKKMKRSLRCRVMTVYGSLEYRLEDRWIEKYGYQTGLPLVTRNHIQSIQQCSMHFSLVKVSIITYSELGEIDNVNKTIEDYFKSLEKSELYIRFRPMR